MLLCINERQPKDEQIKKEVIENKLGGKKNA